MKNLKIDYLCIINTYGEELMRVIPAEKVLQIDHGALPPAIYFISMVGSDCTRISKIVKQ